MTSGAELLESPAARVRAANAGLLTLTLLSLGHFFIDLYSSALGALQPLLKQQFQLSLTQAGILGGLLVFSSSVMQPAYGYLSDRFHTRLFTTLAPAVAGVFISSLGLAPGFGWLLLMVLLGGAGIASFHPQGSARAALTAEARRGRSMAVFISAGTLGMALGPTYFTAVTARLGLTHAWWAAVPGLLVSVLLMALLPVGTAAAPGRGHADWRALRAVWKPLTVLYFLVFIRSILQITYTQFLPLYLHLEKGLDVSTANYTLTMYLASGALGGFVGGHLADRFGGRTVILVSMIGSAPFLALFFLSSGALSLAGLAAGGFVLLFTIPVNVVMGQELLPSQAGTVSALMMGFSWGMAGLLFIPLTGWLSDLFSLHSVLLGLTGFPLIGFLLAMRLPK
jgi:FSR family fosmidomycin resistance protein-like MFS transporter